MKNRILNISYIVIFVLLVSSVIWLFQFPQIEGVMFNTRNILIYITVAYTVILVSLKTLKYTTNKVKDNHRLYLKIGVYLFILVSLVSIGRGQIYYLDAYVIPDQVGCKYYDKYDNLVYETVFYTECPEIELSYEIIHGRELLTFDVEEKEDNKNLYTSVWFFYDIYGRTREFNIKSYYENYEDGTHYYEGLKREVIYNYDLLEVTMEHSFTTFYEESNTELDLNDFDFNDYEETTIKYRMIKNGYSEEIREQYTVKNQSFALFKYMYVDGSLNSYDEIGQGTERINGDYGVDYRFRLTDSVKTLSNEHLFGNGVDARYIGSKSYSEHTTGLYDESISIFSTYMGSNDTGLDYGSESIYSVYSDINLFVSEIRKEGNSSYYTKENQTSILSNEENHKVVKYYDLVSMDTDFYTCDANIRNENCRNYNMFYDSEATGLNQIFSTDYISEYPMINVYNPLFKLSNDYLMFYTTTYRSPLDIEQDNKLLTGFVRYYQEVDQERALEFLKSYPLNDETFYYYEREHYIGSDDFDTLLRFLYQDKELYEIVRHLYGYKIDINFDDIVTTDGQETLLKMNLYELQGDNERIDVFEENINFHYVGYTSNSDILDIGRYRIADFYVANDGYFRLIYNDDGSNYIANHFTSNIEAPLELELEDNLKAIFYKEHVGVTYELYEGETLIQTKHKMDELYQSNGDRYFYRLIHNNIYWDNYGDFSFSIRNIYLFDNNVWIDLEVIDNDTQQGTKYTVKK